MSGNVFKTGGVSGNTISTTSYKSPWNAQAPYIQHGFNQAANLYQQGPYRGPQIGAQSPYTVQAQNMLAQRATDPNSLVARSQNVLGNTISGQYLDARTNPYYQNYADQALGQARNQITSQYADAPNSEVLRNALNTQANSAYSNLWNYERGNQLQALGQAPTLDYAQAQALFGAGKSQEARSQAEVDAQKAQYMEGWNNLQRYQQAIQGNYGGSTTTETPYFTNPLSTLLGLASYGKSFMNKGSGNTPSGNGNNFLNGGGAGGFDPATGDMGGGAFDPGGEGMFGMGAEEAGGGAVGGGAGGGGGEAGMGSSGWVALLVALGINDTFGGGGILDGGSDVLWKPGYLPLSAQQINNQFDLPEWINDPLGEIF